MKNIKNYHLLFLICCFMNTVLPSEEYHINLTKLFKTTILLLPITLKSYQYSKISLQDCGINKYPNAQLWYNGMDEKYPIADLNKYEFCEGVTWFSSGNRILFPPAELSKIDQIYSKKMSNQTVPELDNIVLNQQEFILLHEAGHQKNGDGAH